jgi:spore coat protein U-like protein
MSHELSGAMHGCLERGKETMGRNVSRATPRQFSTSVNRASTNDVDDRPRSRVIEAVDGEHQGDAASPRALPQLLGQGRKPVKCNSVSIAALAAVGLILGAGAASAGTATGTLPVQVTIVSVCSVQGAPLLDFGSQTVLDTAQDGATTIGIQCANTTPYKVRLSAGTGTGATVANRLLTSGAAATVSYSLYRDAARTLVWGETDDTNTVADIGDGSVQSFDVYGRIPAQTTPAPGVYTDSVTVTVAW